MFGNRNNAGHRREREALDAVLESPVFERAPLLSRFLTYICEKRFAGESDQIKEYSIAVEALGRPADFDPSKDSIVRVEAHRLRKRLKAFYESSENTGLLRITIPPGQYVPSFVSPRKGGATGTAPVEETEHKPVPAPEDSRDPISHSPRWRLTATAVVAAAILIALAVGLRLAGDSPDSAAVDAPSERSLGEPVRIMAGSPGGRFVDSSGRVWDRDRYFSGGDTVVTDPPQELAGLPEQLFRSARAGRFEYNIPLEDGFYELRLYVAATDPGRTSQFTLDINGSTAIESFDPSGDAGGRGVAKMRVFAGVSPDESGRLNISVRPSGLLHGLEVVPTEGPTMRPIRILAGQSSGHHDAAGRFWLPDMYYRGGRTATRSTRVDAEDPNLHVGERFGRFRYVLPAAPGRYTLRLHFAETWFLEKSPFGGGEGKRIFDVVVNGSTVLRSVDLVRDTGGELRPMVKTFRRISARDGKVTIDFIPEVNNACVNAIELIPE